MTTPCLERVKRAAAAVAILLTIVPFVIVDHLPLVDLPNHIARLVIRVGLAEDGPLSRFYEYKWGIIPNLAVDLLSYPFDSLVDPQTVVTVIAMLAMCGLYCGTIAIDRALNGPAWGISLLTGVFLFNGALRAGFLNYVVGLAVAVLLFALWIRVRPRLGAGSCALFALAGVVVVLMHMYAFGIYAICVVGYEIGLMAVVKPFRLDLQVMWRRLLPVAVTLLVPLGVIPLAPTAGSAGIVMWSTLHWKVEALTAPVFFSLPSVELPLLAVLAAGLLAGLFTGMLRLRTEMIPVAVLLCVAFLAMPRMLFGSYYADYRLLCGAVFFLLGGLVLVPRSPAWGRAAATLGAGLVLVRVASISLEWHAAQPAFKAFDSAFDSIPAGAIVLVQRARIPSVSQDRSVPMEHVATLPAARRGVFVGNMFTLDAQPLRLTVEALPYYHSGPLIDAPLPLEQYDYYMAIDGPKVPKTTASLVEVRRAGRYVLFKVVP